MNVFLSLMKHIFVLLCDISLRCVTCLLWPICTIYRLFTSTSLRLKKAHSSVFQRTRIYHHSVFTVFLSVVVITHSRSSQVSPFTMYVSLALSIKSRVQIVHTATDDIFVFMCLVFCVLM